MGFQNYAMLDDSEQGCIEKERGCRKNYGIFAQKIYFPFQ
jgi:hypothetical protein